MEHEQDKSNEAQSGQLRQADVSGSAFLRPDSAGGALDSLIVGKTIEVPSAMTMQLLRLWSEINRGRLSLSVEVNGRNRGWTVLKVL